jgi:hypothetical protein
MNDKEAAKERFWQDFGDKGFKVSDKMLEQLYDAGYEAGKNDGIPQGVLDGYDAGFLAGQAKLAEVQKQALEQYGCSCVQCMNLVYTPEDSE